MKNDKQTAVYEGVLKLLHAGADLYAVTVAEIAAAAGIGKGTVYDYFTSKEEIIAGAVAYCVEKSLFAVNRVFENTQGFREKFMKLLAAMDEQAAHGMILWEAVCAGGSETARMKTMLCGTHSLEKAERLVRSLAERLADEGRKEGIVTAKEDDGYICVAVYSAVAGYWVTRRRCGSAERPDADTAREYAYLVLKKALK